MAIYALRNYTTLDMTTQGGTETPVAGIHNAEIVASVDITKFNTADSIFTQDKMQSGFNVQVSIEFGNFDESLAKEWLAGDGGSSATSMTDTSRPKQFSLTGTFESRGGSDQIEMTVEEITFEDMPLFSGGEDEYANWSIEGEGAKLTNFDVTTPV